MNIWLGDYLKLRNEIKYLEFKLTDDALSAAERKETEQRLEKRLFREGEFKILVNCFEGIENKILLKRYVEGKTLISIADELGYSYNYIKKQHVNITNKLKVVEKFNNEWQLFKKNFPINKVR